MYKFFALSIFLALTCFCLAGAFSYSGADFQKASASTTTAPAKQKEASVYDLPYHERLIVLFANRYKVERDLMRCIVQRESGFKQYAVGDSGLAVGPAQFHLATYRSFRRLMGKDTQDQRTDQRTEWTTSLETLAWGLATGRERNWSTFEYCRRTIR